MARQKTTTTASPSTPAVPVADAKRSNAVATKSGPTHEDIARRAYEIFLARGGEHGHHAEDWEQAENELRLGRQ